MSVTEMTYDCMDLRQLTELEYILLGDLRDVLEEESTQENRRWMSALVDALLKTLPREFAIREEGGYMRDILINSPELDPNVQTLLDQHGSLCAQLQKLADQLETVSLFEQQADQLKQQLTDWMEALKAHNRSEEMLVQQAYQQDTGCGD